MNDQSNQGKKACCLKDLLLSLLGWLKELLSPFVKLGCLVAPSVLFILTIVIALFGNKFTGYSVTLPILNRPTISLTSVFLFVVSIIIAVLSGCLVNQRVKKDKDDSKQREITENIGILWITVYKTEKVKLLRGSLRKLKDNLTEEQQYNELRDFLSSVENLDLGDIISKYNELSKKIEKSEGDAYKIKEDIDEIISEFNKYLK